MNNTITKPLNQNKMKQTAVEFLVEALVQECGLDEEGDMAKYIIEQAKEMEKEQIKNERVEAYNNGYANGQKDAYTE